MPDLDGALRRLEELLAAVVRAESLTLGRLDDLERAEALLQTQPVSPGRFPVLDARRGGAQ